MGIDYIPRQDAAFAAWLKVFLSGAQACKDRSNVSAGQLAELEDAIAKFSSALQGHLNLQRQAQAARAQKDKLRSVCERAIRQIVRQIQASPRISSADRAGMAIRVRKERIGSAAADAPPASAPHLRIVNRMRMHMIHFVDQKTPTRKSKPARVGYCQVWRAITGPRQSAPKAPDAWHFVDHASATPLPVRCEIEQAGERAWYKARWVSVRGKHGPWSNTTSALISD